MHNRVPYIFLSVIVFLSACSKKEDVSDWPFQSMPAKLTGINYKNHVENSADFNIFRYRNFYNGGGVALGDVNNDGLTDIFFTSNLSSNKLYVNEGGFKFKDVTEAAGVSSENKWSTGVVFVDINHDGKLDIYVCNAGCKEGQDQKNELFINHGDNSFVESAADYGLDDNGYTTHAAFFDYDNDGDLDAYILNNSFMPVNSLNFSNKRELPASEWEVPEFLRGGGDKFLRNDDGKYVDITQSAGIYNSLIGFGLGITVGDVNKDRWPDIYVSNDFFERDYLYINQKDGTFKEEIENYMDHISMFSMGADMADINNDGASDIFVTDMLPDNDYRLKTTSSFDFYNTYNLKLKKGFYHQYMQNTLQVNRDGNSFTETALFSGVSSSDWSWGALIFDVNNDGHSDIYVCNGIYQDVTDQDFIDYFANDLIQRTAASGSGDELDELIALMPSNPLKNKLFMNKGGLSFEDISENSKENTPTFSNGGAYGDLDNDGDLDLVINNVNQEALVFKNLSERNGNHYLKVKLNGVDQNTFAIGSTVSLYSGENHYHRELIPSRGFQSSIDYNMVFGLGENDQLDSMQIIWPDKTAETHYNIPVDTLLVFQKSGSAQLEEEPTDGEDHGHRYFSEVDFDFEKHTEDEFVDFYHEGLLIRMLSREGPKAAVADVNGDGKDDVYICGAKGQAGKLYIQSDEGYAVKQIPDFNYFIYFEDTYATFFDVDNDGDQDLFVGSGGNNEYPESREMHDRIFRNDGEGNFVIDGSALPKNGFNTSVAVPLDFDGDGDMDLFVGTRSVPLDYGVTPGNYLFENDGAGKFRNVVQSKAPQLYKLGMITDAALVDLVRDERKELLVVGEWMAPTIFAIENGKLSASSSNLTDFKGWWNAIEYADLDNDGDKDLVLGNRGENFYFSADKDHPSKLWVADFDNNGTKENIITRNIGDKDVTIHLKKELTEQLVSLKKQNLKYSEFATKSIQELFTEDELGKALVKESNWFKSTVAINEGNGTFNVQALPMQAQLSVVSDIYLHDFNNDGLDDILLGGNDFGFTPQFSRQDACNGTLLVNNGNGDFSFEDNTGIHLKGALKQFQQITFQGESYLICLLNDEKPKVYKILDTQENTL